MYNERACKDGWTRWCEPSRKSRMRCCDCGLVHMMEFRVRAGRAQFRIKRVSPHPVKCVRCGCTERRACKGGCSWVAPGLCSRCDVKGGY
jgi:hypothetical protein